MNPLENVGCAQNDSAADASYIRTLDRSKLIALDGIRKAQVGDQEYGPITGNNGR